MQDSPGSSAVTDRILHPYFFMAHGVFRLGAKGIEEERKKRKLRKTVLGFYLQHCDTP